MAGERNLSGRASGREWVFECFRGRLFCRNSILRGRRHLVGAASACTNRAVGDQPLAFSQVHFLFGPENLVPNPIGEIYEPGLLELHHFGPAAVESGKMSVNHAIMETCLMQLFW